MKTRLLSELKIKMFTLLSLLMISYLIGSASALFLKGRFIDTKSDDGYSEIRAGGYKFIQPLMMCNGDDDLIDSVPLRDLKGDVDKTIDAIIAKKHSDSVAVYFKDFKTGAWFAIGEEEKFHPASIMKVTTLLAVLKQAEADPSMLQRKVKNINEENLSVTQELDSSKSIEWGKEYSIDDLLYRMIVYSDNKSANLLYTLPSVATLTRTYNDLAIPNPYRLKEDDYITVEEVAHIFRVLYNATFLNNEQSEKALMTLSKTEFEGGIKGGTPAGITVAHKFGYWKSGEQEEKKQLHDCGIVYYPGSSYLLCIMTKGDRYEDLSESVKELSGAVFNNVRGSSLKAYPSFAGLTPQ